MKHKKKIIISIIIFLLLIIVSSSKSYGQCSATYEAGTVVKLTATACPGWIFVTWTGDCSHAGRNKECSITMNSDKNVSAIFLPKPDNLKITGEPITLCEGTKPYVLKVRKKDLNM